MSLGWRTYQAMPRLKTYADAKKYYDSVKPIRGDKHETRPLGRRNQKYVSIWEDTNGAVHAGYGVGEIAKRQPLVTYHKSGVISLYRYGVWLSASDRERIQRVLGVSMTHLAYDPYISCTWYDGGEQHNGWLPLRTTNRRVSWQDGQRVNVEVSNFVRDQSDNLVFLNYQYPRTHRINRQEYARVTEPYQPCINYIHTLQKLQGGRLEFGVEMLSDMFGTTVNWNGRTVPLSPPRLSDIEELLPPLMTSDKLEDWLRAAAILAYYSEGWYSRYSYETDGISSPNPLKWFGNNIVKVHCDIVLTPTIHTDGKLHKDRFRRLVIS